MNSIRSSRNIIISIWHILEVIRLLEDKGDTDITAYSILNTINNKLLYGSNSKVSERFILNKLNRLYSNQYISRKKVPRGKNGGYKKIYSLSSTNRRFLYKIGGSFLSDKNPYLEKSKERAEKLGMIFIDYI